MGPDAASLLVLNVAGKRLAMIDLADAMRNAMSHGEPGA
jgi:hypothetical protein